MFSPNVVIALQILGGIGLLLFGVRKMSEGLQKVAGRRLRRILEVMTGNRVTGVIVGALVTATVQSSTAVTVMVVGFVNAALLSFSQGVCLMMGANIGTTITAQMIAFKLTDLAMPAIFAGVILIHFAKRRNWRDLGEVLLGFGLLFLGLKLMQQAVAPLSQSSEFIAFFTYFRADDFSGVILNVFVGMILCMCIQASSVAVGITMVLASSGLLTFPGAVALVLGDNIGTTLTAELSAIGSSLEARRAARANSMFNILGVCYILVFFYPFLDLVQWLGGFVGAGPAYLEVGGEYPYVARNIANSHTLFNMINTLVFILALPVLIKVATVLTPKGRAASKDLAQPQYINFRFDASVSASLAEAREETARMAAIARESFRNVSRIPVNHDEKALDLWQEPESALNSLQKHITQFLVQVSQMPTSEGEGKEISLLMQAANNVERIGDSIKNLAGLCEEMFEQDLVFTELAVNEYQTMTGTVAEFMDRVFNSVSSRNRAEINMEEAVRYEEAIDDMRDHMREDHVERLRQGQCSVDAGLVFVNMIANYERIGDYLYNISLILKDLRRL
ncbi:MAG: Na/Pi cotransporter family protein [Desulfarculales bacterium]|jgi:phosphate:Na+ symporter|nr:Na/Pi cotransporter family protein [Desulfarculales bacterium]